MSAWTSRTRRHGGRANIEKMRAADFKKIRETVPRNEHHAEQLKNVVDNMNLHPAMVLNGWDRLVLFGSKSDAYRYAAP